MPNAPRRSVPRLAVHPLTPKRWPDLVRLFGPRGACAGCWCMWWRLTSAEFHAATGDRKRAALERYVRGGRVPGLLAYEGAEPVGWVAIEPREVYPRLARSRTLAPVDDAPVWSITCFFVARSRRRKGLTRALIDAALGHARAAGASAVEAYPVDLRKETGDAFVYTGAASTFLDLGFEVVARRSPSRPIVRRATGRAASRPRSRAGAGSRGAAGSSRAR